MDPLHALPNIGPVSAAWLAAVGVGSLGDLQRIGSVAAYARVQRVRPHASRNLLWALEAALRECDWRQLSPEDKDQLERELERLVA